MSNYQATGLSWHLWRPSVVVDEATTPNHSAYNPRGSYVADITQRVSDYQHTHALFGGFDAASFSIIAARDELETWWETGPGLHLEVVDETGVIAWEGFVNALEIALEALTVQRGPLTDVANQLWVAYQPYDTSTNPPTHGASQILAALEGVSSQRRYGIWPEYLNLNAGTAALALQVANIHLLDNEYPRISQNVNLGGGGSDPRITFDCRGYSHMLTGTYFNSATGTVGASTKLAAILNWENAYANGLFSSANASITANLTALPACETEYLDMRSQIMEIVSVGDAAYNRYVFLVEEGRKVTYKPIPSTTRYRMALSSSDQQVQTFEGETVRPWNVRAGEWLIFTDWLAASSPPSDRRIDPRYMLIERATYTAPYNVALDGGRSGRIDQRMAQFGLAGQE